MPDHGSHREVHGDPGRFCFLIVIKYIRNKVQHLTKTHNSVAFSTLTVLYNHHHHPVPERLHHAKRNSFGSFIEEGHF